MALCGAKLQLEHKVPADAACKLRLYRQKSAWSTRSEIFKTYCLDVGVASALLGRWLPPDCEQAGALCPVVPESTCKRKACFCTPA